MCSKLKSVVKQDICDRCKHWHVETDVTGAGKGWCFAPVLGWADGEGAAKVDCPYSLEIEVLTEGKGLDRARELKKTIGSFQAREAKRACRL